MSELLDFAAYGKQLILYWKLATRAGFLVVIRNGTLSFAGAIGLTVTDGQVDIGRHLKRIVRFHDEHLLGR